MRVRTVVTAKHPKKTHLLSTTQRLDFGVSLCGAGRGWKLATDDQDWFLPGCPRCVLRMIDLGAIDVTARNGSLPQGGDA